MEWYLPLGSLFPLINYVGRMCLRCVAPRRVSQFQGNRKHRGFGISGASLAYGHRIVGSPVTSGTAFNVNRGINGATTPYVCKHRRPDRSTDGGA